jgi:hypothetical protein
MVGHKGMANTFGEDNGGTIDPLMEDQVGSFPLEHEFPEDYGLDEEDGEIDIDGEPLFVEAEVVTQANAKMKRKSKRTKAGQTPL